MSKYKLKLSNLIKYIRARNFKEIFLRLEKNIRFRTGGIVYYYRKLGHFIGVRESSCMDANKNPLPWYPYPAIQYLDQIDFSEKHIFEYGSGNSSLWWAQRAKSVISVENNEQWYQSRLAFKKDNLEIHLEKDKDNYLKCIHKNDKKFDVIIIDGLYRHECAKISPSCLAEDGIIIFDNSDLAATDAEYNETITTLSKNMLRVNFTGIPPTLGWATTTSIFFSTGKPLKFKPEYKLIGTV